MPDRTERLRATVTAVTKTPVPPQRHTAEVIATSDHRLRTQHAHHYLPFLAMRADIPQPIQHIREVMCHLVRHRIGQVISKIFCKDIRVITYTALSFVNPVHACCPTLQIKCDCRQLEFAPQQPASAIYAFTGCIQHLLLPCPGNRFQRHVMLPFFVRVKPVSATTIPLACATSTGTLRITLANCVSLTMLIR